MARRTYSSRYSRSSRRRSSGGGPRRRYTGAKRRSRYTTRRRTGRAGVLSEVKYVNNIRGRKHMSDDGSFGGDADKEVGATLITWRDTGAGETGRSADLGLVKKGANTDAGISYNAGRYGVTSKSYLLTHCRQGFEEMRRVGLSINPRSFIFRATLTAARLSQLQTAGGYNDGELEANTGQLVTGTGGGLQYLTRYCRTSIRLVFFRDMEPPLELKPPSTVVASLEPRTWADLFAASGAQGSTTDFLRTDNIGRFQVVHDTTLDLDSDDPQKSIQIRIPIAKVLRYGGPEGNQIRSGHYFVVACAEALSLKGDEPNGRLFPPVIAYQHRMAFTDS